MRACHLSIQKHILFYMLFLLAATEGKGQTRSITYQWLNLPCAENINCATGCSACNEPSEEDLVVFGTNAALIGVDACPHPVESGDNALALSGWSTSPEDAHRIIISGIAQVPVRIDSIIIVHRRDVDGPARLSISVKDLGDGEGMETDVATSETFDTSVLTECGEVEKPSGSAFGTFQVQLKAYLGNGGDWVLDEVRIVVTVIEGISTGITAVSSTPSTNAERRIDLLGRATNASAADLRFRTGNTIIVQ
jgi:hypothetical protein